MNLYIINEVLYDYTDGMVVIAAESKEHCEQIFMEKFGYYYNCKREKVKSEEMQKQFDYAPIKVIENVNHPEGIVSYVYGGG
jgi:hypothetical protein